MVSGQWSMVNAQKGSLYLHMTQSGTTTTYNLTDISKVHFAGNTMDIVTAGGTDSYAYTPLNTGTVSSDPDPQVDYTNGFGTDGSYEAPSQDANGYYLIDNGGKLFWLAEQVNNGTGATYNAKLTADIDLENRAWTPMGSAANTHGGEFDGQSHSITGLSVNTNAQYTAFIGYHNGTTSVHDFSLAGNVTYTGNTGDHCVAGVIAFNVGVNTVEDIICSVNIETPNATANVRIAGIVAREDNAGTINRCTYSGTNNGYGTAMQVAGIVGMAGTSGNNMKVTNCLFTGTLKATNTGAYVGGIAGYIGKSGTSFKNCLSVGSYDVPSGATRTGALIGAGNGNVTATTFSNCYILTDQPEKGTSSGISATISYTAVNDAQLANGTITAALGDNWAQGAATPYPSDPNAQPADHTHSFVNGFCTDAACTAPYEAAAQDGEGYYLIDNGGKLFWLAQQVNSGAGTAYDAKLTADIDLENRTWTPMGDDTNQHKGEFDGQGFSITGLNIAADAAMTRAAFIGYHGGTKDVHSFRIAGTVTASGTAENNYAAGVVAYSVGVHNIQDIWCSVNVTNLSTGVVALRMAGVVTKAESSTINRCVYDGTLTGEGTNSQAAGILGWPNANNTTVSNCLFIGTLTSTGTGNNSAYMGGIVGYSPSTRSGLVLANNLSAGTLNSPSEATRTGALSGRNTTAVSSFTNNYILSGQPVAGSASGSTPSATQVTAAEIADGTVVANLGSEWVQNGDTPVPLPFGPTTHTHTYVNGFCTDAACTEPYQPAIKDTDDYYVISNGGKLFWFAQQVNDGTGTKYNAKLTADIDLENRAWTPMGNNTNQFYGAFDGQGHSITNLNVESADQYVGFIGVHNYDANLNTDIVNFKLYGNVKYTGTGETSDWVAGVVAWDYGVHKMQDVWSYVNIETPNALSTVSYPRVGGVVGQVSKSSNSFDRCVYAGTINAGNAAYIGGVVAYPASSVAAKVSNCLFVGTIKSTRTDAYIGGIVSYSNTTASSWTNNLAVGSFELASGSTRAGVFGGYANKKSYNNNYVCLGNGLDKAYGSGTPAVPDGVTGVAITEVTAAELTDGTLPARLSSLNWSQGTNYPIPGDYSTITEDDMTVDGIKYAITSDNTVEVTYPNDATPSSSNPCTYSGSITIPASITIKGNTYNVTGIGDYAFHYANVTSLTLPEGITKLGYKAIYQTKLTEITVPNSVTLMDYEALGYNKQLVTIRFGENIAANTWGDKLCIYGDHKYEVYMNCNAVPALRSYTFDFTGANVHVRPTMYSAFKADAVWSTYDIIGDLWIEYTYDDLQTMIANTPVPSGDVVGSDPGCYTPASVQALADAIAAASALDNTATLEQLNTAISSIINASDALQTVELQEGYYAIENIYKPYALYGDANTADTQGLKLETPYDASKEKFFFKLTRQGGNWLIQSVDNGMYVGTIIDASSATSANKYISLTTDPDNEQIITWVAGGAFKIQGIYNGSTTLPYAYYNYGAMTRDCTDSETRIRWHFHPAEPGKYPLEFNLENGRVRGFVHDFEYTASDASKISTYKKNPPARLDQPVPATVFWTRNASSTAQYITWSTDATFADATTVEVDNNIASYEIYNLNPGNTYYYKVTATVGGAETELLSSTFTTTGTVRMIKAEGISNIRDLGGWNTASGNPIAYGKIYRGAAFKTTTITPEGIATMRDVGIKAELDLRDGSQDGSMSASLLGSDVDYYRTNLAQTASLMTGLTGSKDKYIASFNYVLNCVKNDKPVYFHCEIGRDRTGTLAFLIHGVLGVSKSDLYKDFELTNFSNLNTPCSKGQLDEVFTMIEALDGATLEDKFYTYLTTEFGVSAADLDEFRTKMLGLSDMLTAPEAQAIITTETANGATVVDLSAYTFDPAITAADLAAEGNIMVIVPDASSVDGQNIIHNGVCQSLVITDKAAFDPGMSFTATTATYVKTLADGGWYSAVLPYEFEIPEGVQVAGNASVSGTVITFEDFTGTVAANTPFIYRKENGGNIAFNTTNAEIAVASDLVSGQLIGTYAGLPVGSATGKLILNNEGSAFGVATETASIPPFRAYINASVGASATFTIFIDDDPTGIESYEDVTEKKSQSVYDISGRRIPGEKAAVKGIIITEGKKILK